MAPPETIITEYDDPVSETFLWECLLEESGGDEMLSAAVLGYFYRESRYRSDAVTSWSRELSVTGEDPCEAFTKKLDRMSRSEFVESVRKRGGYGLGQWYAEEYLEQLYDFCKGRRASFADAKMQCAFTVHSIINDDELMERLESMSTPSEYGKIIGKYYDGSATAGDTIAFYAHKIYTERTGDT